MSETLPEGDAKERTETKPKKPTKKNKSWLWAIQIFILTFFLSTSFSVLSNLLLSNAHYIISIIALAAIILINILFDVVGVAVTSCSVEPFLAMASRKKPAAKTAVKIVKNAEKVANICADVVGDICSIISGALGASIVVQICASGIGFNEALVSILFSAMIAAFTVGGKSLGKKIAMDNSQAIIYFVARIFSVFQRKPRARKR